jgi:hypothetical protein
MFPSPDTRAVDLPTINRDDLNQSGAGPVLCAVHFRIHADPARSGIGHFGSTQLQAVLQAGALINISRTFASPAGWNNSYSLDPPSYAQFAEVSGDHATLNGGSIEVSIDATSSGSAQFAGPVKAVLEGNPAPVRPTHGDMALNVSIAVQTFSDTVDGLPVAIHAQGDLHVIDVGDRFSGTMPSNVSLPFVTANGFRILYAAQVIHDSDLANASAKINAQIQSQIQTAFGSPVPVTSHFDATSLAVGAPASEPVRFVGDANATRSLGTAGSLTAHQVTQVAQVVLESGATVHLSLNLTGLAKTNTTYLVSLPSTLAFENVTGASSSTASLVTVALPGWNVITAPKAAIAFDLNDPQASAFHAENVSIAVNLDLTTHIDLVNAIQTHKANMDVAMNASATLGVLKIPSALQSKIPSIVRIEFLPADALRKLYQLGILTEANVSQIQSTFGDQAAGGLSNVTGSKVPVTVVLDRAQLNETVGSSLGASRPIVIYATAALEMPLAGNHDRTPGGADFTLAQFPLNLPLPSLQGYPTTFKVTLPTGISIVSVSSADAAHEALSSTTTSAGRALLTATVTDGKTVNTAMTIGITPAFLLDQFLPWIILLAIIVIAIIALPIWGIVRLARRGKRKGPKGPTEAASGGATAGAGGSPAGSAKPPSGPS